MIGALYLSLTGIGLLVAILVPLAVATFPAWEWRVLCWLDRRRKAREARRYRLALRRPYGR